MSKIRKWYVVLIALAVIAVAWGIGARIFMANKAAPASPLATVSFAYSTNAKGQPWVIQTGKSNFTVSSKETYPRFVLGTINPTKVALGDTQTMQIVVRDNVPLTKVWAEVEHDHGIDSIPLTLGASSTVSYNTIQNQKYLVGNDGKLVVNEGVNKTPAVVALIQSLFQKASAEQAVDYSYSGSWVVHDTATITYHTTFYAMDAQGRTAQLVLAWSDPCSNVTYGVFYGDCSLAMSTDGTDATSTSLNGHSLTLGAGGTWVVNPTYSVIIGSGSILLNGGSLSTQEYLYYPDSDGDQYSATTTKSADTVSSKPNFVRVSQALGTNDCNDSDAHANPGDTAWWADSQSTGWSGVPAGNFNCDGTLGAYINLYNSGYQTSGYPGIYNGSSYVSMNKVSLSLATAYCYYNSGNGAAVGLYVSSSACGSVYSGSANTFWYYSSGTNLPTTCGSSVAWQGNAVQVCK